MPLPQSRTKTDNYHLGHIQLTVINQHSGTYRTRFCLHSEKDVKQSFKIADEQVRAWQRETGIDACQHNTYLVNLCQNIASSTPQHMTAFNT